MGVYFEDYDPQRFASLYADVGPKLKQFFASPVVVALLEGSVKLRRPAVEAIEERLLEYAKDDVKNQRVRQLVGHMIRHLMEELGYELAQPEVRLPSGVLFTCGARYRAKKAKPKGRLSKAVSKAHEGPHMNDHRLMAQQDDCPELTEVELKQIQANGQRLLVLWRGFPERHFFREWQRFGLGCVTRAYHTLRRILEIDDDGPDTATLARSLFDHVVALAWMAEDPEVLFPMILRKGLANASVMGAELDRAGNSIIEEETLERLRRDADGRRAPSVQAQALAADVFWASKVPDWGWGFSRQYSSLFRSYSLCAHPTHLGLESFFDERGQLIFDPTDAGMGNIRAQSVACFADALVVASQLFGWPRMEDVGAVYTHGMIS